MLGLSKEITDQRERLLLKNNVFMAGMIKLMYNYVTNYSASAADGKRAKGNKNCNLMKPTALISIQGIEIVVTPRSGLSKE